jgi:hypothetical protein
MAEFEYDVAISFAGEQRAEARTIERNASRLVLSVEPIPGFPVSEVEVIGSIYRLCAVERKSCQKIADHLNQMGLPCGPVALPCPESTGQPHPKVPIWRRRNIHPVEN